MLHRDKQRGTPSSQRLGPFEWDSFELRRPSSLLVRVYQETSNMPTKLRSAIKQPGACPHLELSRSQEAVSMIADVKGQARNGAQPHDCPCLAVPSRGKASIAGQLHSSCPTQLKSPHA